MADNDYLLWEDDNFVIKTPLNPHIPYSEGFHLVVVPKLNYEGAWDNPELSAKAFELATQACKIMKKKGIAPWFNIQANGNWGLLPGAQPFFHVHIYGRNKTENWGKPIKLPKAPGTFHNDPIPESDRAKLKEAFQGLKTAQ